MVIRKSKMRKRWVTYLTSRHQASTEVEIFGKCFNSKWKTRQRNSNTHCALEKKSYAKILTHQGNFTFQILWFVKRRCLFYKIDFYYRILKTPTIELVKSVVASFNMVLNETKYRCSQLELFTIFLGSHPKALGHWVLFVGRLLSSVLTTMFQFYWDQVIVLVSLSKGEYFRSQEKILIRDYWQVSLLC